MKKKFKACIAWCLVALALSHEASAQTFTLTANNTGGNLYKVTGMSLTALTTSSGSNTINPGDIIVMPWITPGSAGSTNDIEVTANPSGTSPVTVSWTTKGDIGVVSGGSGTIAGLNTINEQTRSGSYYDYGQSKGRVIYKWSTTPNTCGDQLMYFDIIKSFSGTNVNQLPPTLTIPTPPIIGPGCLLPNTSYTFSVDPIVSDNLTDQIGLDRYFWNTGTIAIQSGTTYYSTDSSSITFTTDATNPFPSGSTSITCNFGVANTSPWGSNTAVATKSVYPAPGVPTVTLSGSLVGTAVTNNCLPTYLTGTHSLTLTVTSQPGASYQWSFGTNGGTLANGWNTSPPATGAVPYTATGTSLTITDVLNQPGIVTLTVTDACGNANTYTYNFVRQLTQTNAALITGMTSPLCVTAGNPVTGTLTANANQNNVSWSNSNFTFSSGGSPYSITPLSTLATGTYTVTATFGCSTSATYPINVVATNAPTITVVGGGSPCGTSGSMVSFAANPAPSTGTTYTWTLSGGTGYSCSGCGTATANSTVTVTIGTSGTASLTLKENTSGSSSCSSPTSTATSIGIAPSSFSITPPCTVLNYPSVIPVTCTNVSPASYQWAVSNTSIGTLSGTNPTTTPTINFNANGTTFGSEVYSVTATLASGCIVTASTSSLTYSSSPAPFSMTGPTYEPASGGDPEYMHLDVSGGGLSARYTWVQCLTSTTSSAALSTGTYNGSNPTAGNSQWNFTVPNPGNTINYGAILTKNGCSYRICADVTGFSNMVSPHNPGDLLSIMPEFRLYPNPSNGKFIIHIGNTTQAGTMSLFNTEGKKIMEKSLKPGANEFEIKVAAGIYQIKMSVDGYEKTDKLVVTE